MLSAQDAAVIKGMLARGDKQHDIAAFFGQNGARINEIKSGEKFAEVKPTKADLLPAPIRPPRYINPNTPLEDQVAVLKALMNDPPENSRVIVITPILAQWIIDNLNTKNRKKRPKRIQTYARGMTAGWVLNGATLVFSRTALLDGQNRLFACIISQKTFKTHVVFGIDGDAFDSIDAGISRTGSDTFYVAEIKDWRITSPATRWIRLLEEAWSANKHPRRGDSDVSNPEHLNYYFDHVAKERMAQAAKRARKAPAKIFDRGQLAALLYTFDKADPDRTKRFALDLEKTQRGVLKLSRALDELRGAQLGRMHENQRAAMIIRTWNAYRHNRVPHKRELMWTEAQDFPHLT
jgi:hypothetical protein